MFKPKTGVVFVNRHKNTQKNRKSQVERFITKKVIAIAVCEVLSSFAITRFRPNLCLRKSQVSPQLLDESSHLLWLVSFFLYSHLLGVFLTGTTDSNSSFLTPSSVFSCSINAILFEGFANGMN